MKKTQGLFLVLLFTSFIGVFFLLNIAIPDRTFSDQENRTLQQFPKFTFSSLFNGSFTSDCEKYAADQFAFRDFWIPVKARTELTIGKHENNGVYYCRDNTLITRFTAPDYSSLDAKLSAVDSFAQKAGVPVRFALIPGAADIWSAKLPENAPNDSQKAVIDYCYSKLSVPCTDIYSVLRSHADDYIYYRTDHHWTSLGAYYGYTALMDDMGLAGHDISEYKINTVTDSFYGTTYSSSGFSWIRPDSIETYVRGDAAAVESYTNGLNTAPVRSGLYVSAFLEKKDKYSMFLGGVTPLVHITSKNSDAPSLLIVRDSYTDSLAPFMTQDFSDIYIVDLRYFRENVADFVKEKGIDSVLVLYSVSNFCSDDNVVLLGM